MEVTQEILAGRRSLESVEGYRLIEDVDWNEGIQRWTIRFSLALDLPPNEYIASTTNWYLVLESSYPKGAIKIYPDKVGGITATFQHQNINISNSKYAWRTGDICVSTGVKSIARGSFDTEPSSANARLSWYVKRCREWILAAAKNKLSLPDDHFELPDFSVVRSVRIAFTKDVCALASWQNVPSIFGLATLRHLGRYQLYVIEAFSSRQDGRFLEALWGRNISHSIASNNGSSEVKGAWILFNSVPVMAPWKSPQNWKELVCVAKSQGISLLSILISIYTNQKISIPSWLLIGFPIPATIGVPPSQIHWQALELPTLPKVSGFRHASPQAVKAALSVLIGREKELKWIATEDWSQESIAARGTIEPSFAQQSILLIGVGALGSMLAEVLVRLGCIDITLVDNDIVEIGNMARHVLSTNDVGRFKAEALAEHLNRIIPHANVNHHSQSVQDLLQNNGARLQEFDTVIDATASDDVIEFLDDHLDNEDKLFVSASLGMRAKRIFCFTSFAQTEIAKQFHIKVSPWLDKEVTENQGIDLPREGIGCWHPLFPARCDDVWMLANACVKIIESNFKGARKPTSELIILEQKLGDYGFSGIEVIKESADE
ncbi:ThiF family adenylyltransferase [Tunicatimonas pelagia]|uniref:ThiF family adenylyltransferase n=1 Tax=Tunicatimonas pelagia TaxID=931531 RepID=UPI002665363C|nr:ThiF family adenylyltransferase [Tunicatimonas pelagia]WKN44911.1 ThiF family adenylyltransferase [Tunicatimonas pelagia]